VKLAGSLLIALVAVYLAATVFRRAPLRIGWLSIPLPSPGMAAAQLMLSSADWILAGAVLYGLLPEGAPPFLPFLGGFLVAILLGMISHVPGGLGIFEGLMVLALKPWLSAAELLPAFAVYRAIYYLVPFVVALAALVADEVRRRRAQFVRAAGWLGEITEQLAPRALAAITFFAGALLLFSGATPAASGRLDLLHRILPLGVIEMSHFAGSIAGAGLLLVSHGLSRRLDAAYYLASALIVVGMAASLLKGFDVEEAALLLFILLVLARARPAFHRRATFFETRFAAEWIAAVVGAVGASIWLGFFAFKHVEYRAELWWRFELSGEASRFLRASVGAAVVVLFTGLARLLGHPRHEIDPPGEADLADAARVIAAQPNTSPNLVFLGDKGVLFDDARDAFVMYGVQGRSWVALGDPVGAERARHDLIRAFLERADDFGGAASFYEVGSAGLHHYADFGLTFVKLGEDARVDLAGFTIDGGGQAAKHRHAVRRLERDGGAFRVLAPAEVPGRLPELRRVSDDWLAQKAAAEKGFSLGFFDEQYLQRFPIGVIERGGVIQAFANVWSGADRIEVSLDLMRFSADAPKGVMEALLVHLMLWGREQGYQRFSLGMAPLSGFERSPVASLWQRAGSLLYEYGEPVYGFQGLRAFKEKFSPAWEPRYLAYSSVLGLPRLLADISALIAGGYRRIFMK
jgi:phosphatidylglycerol lysyltransferase